MKIDVSIFEIACSLWRASVASTVGPDMLAMEYQYI
jgi:hypothetical protein